MNEITEIFKDKPHQWGFRGDPYLWEELEDRLLKIGFISKQDFPVILDTTFEEFIEKEGTHRREESIVIAAFPKGGMSGGVVSLKWWYDIGLPLLKRRFAELPNL